MCVDLGRLWIDQFISTIRKGNIGIVLVHKVTAYFSKCADFPSPELRYAVKWAFLCFSSQNHKNTERNGQTLVINR